jgi:hypothetical protein
MVRSLETRSIRSRIALVGVGVLLLVTASAYPRAPSGTPVDPGVASGTLMQAEPIDIPVPTSDPFIG